MSCSRTHLPQHAHDEEGLRQYVGGMVKGREGAACLQPCWWLSLVLATPRAGMEAGASPAAPSPGPSPRCRKQGPTLIALPLSASALNGGGRKREGAEDEWVGGRPRGRLFVLGGEKTR